MIRKALSIFCLLAATSFFTVPARAQVDDRTAMPKSHPRQFRAGDEGAYIFGGGDCEFELVFPGEPVSAQRCMADKPQSCTPTTSFTKVFDMKATVKFTVACGKTESGMFDHYNGSIMEATLRTMAKANGLQNYETGYQEFENAKQAVIMGHDQWGQSDRIYISQLWVGRKSILTVEAELLGEADQEAEDIFMDIVGSIRQAGENPPETAEKEKKEPAAKQQEDKPAAKP